MTNQTELRERAQAVAYEVMRNDPGVWHESLVKSVDAVLALVSEQVEAAERKASDLFDEAIRQKRQVAEVERERDRFQISYHAARAETAQYAAVIERLRMLPARVDEVKGESWIVAKAMISVISSVDAAVVLAERDAGQRGIGWDEACQALAWCFDNGPERDALPYLVEHNPYKPKETNQ